MPVAVRRSAGWADLAAEAARHPMENIELVDGEFLLSPRPSSRGGRSHMSLGHFVGGPFDFDPKGPGGWWIVTEPEVQFTPHDILIPDVAGWRRSTLPQLPSARPVDVVPDWVCEVISPSTQNYDRVAKADVYFRAGVPYYWLLDPYNRLLEVLRSEERGWLRIGGWSDGATVRIPPFEAIDLDVGLFFPPPESTPG